MDPEFGKFKAGSGINHSGSTTLIITGYGVCCTNSRNIVNIFDKPAADFLVIVQGSSDFLFVMDNDKNRT